MSMVTRHTISTLPSRSPSFLSLPAEIRRLIYATLMTSHHDSIIIRVDADPKIPIRTTPSVKIHLAINKPTRQLSHSFPIGLMCTNRQIHAEATQYFYTHVTRRLHVGRSQESPDVWPSKDWPYQYRGWIGLEIVAQTLHSQPQDKIDHFKLDLDYFLFVMWGARVRSVFLHAREKELEEAVCEYRRLAALGALVGGKQEVVIGMLRDRADEGEERTYHFMTEASRGGRGSGPYGDVKYERVISLDSSEKDENQIVLWRRFGDRNGGESAMMGVPHICG